MKTEIKQREVGDLVTPIASEELSSRIKRIVPDHWTDRDIYILENGTVYTDDELE